MSQTPRVVNVRFPHAMRTRQLTVALGCILIAVILALALLWLLVYQSIIASAQGQPTSGLYNTRLELSWYGAAGEILKQPSGIAFDDLRQRVLVTDSRRAKVYVLSPDGQLITSFDGGASGDYTLELPTSIAVASTGQIYVVDAARGTIVIFDELFKPLRALRFVEEPPKAVAVIADAEGVEHVWVLSFSGLSRANLDGDFDWGYFARGSAPGQFSNPSDLAGLSREASTTVFVVDSFNYRLQALDVAGQGMAVRWIYGDPPPADTTALEPDQPDPTTPGQDTADDAQPASPAAQPSASKTAERLLDVPVSVATDGQSRVFVLDGMSATVLTLDADTGELITAFGTVGSQEGDLLYPSAIAFGNERIWVVDQGNARVSAYSQTEAPQLVQAVRQHFPLELLWLLILLLAAIELGCLIWLASIKASRLVFSIDALERIEVRKRGAQVSEVVEHVNVTEGLEAYARTVCTDARVATVSLKKRVVRALEPLRESLDALDFDTLVAAASIARGVLVCDSQAPLFAAALEANIPVVDITELIQYADSVVDEDESRV